jgi:hypothetical protein
MSLISYAYVYIKSKGFGNTDHSQANFMISQMMTIFMVILYLWWSVTLKLWFKKPNEEENERKKKSSISIQENNIITFLRTKKLFLGWICGWVLFWFSLYWIKIANSCSEINRGLMSLNAYSNDGGECVWERGDVCWHYTIEGIFTPLYYGRDKCTDVMFKDDISSYKKM